MKKSTLKVSIAESARDHTMSNNSGENQSSTDMAEEDKTEEKLQLNLSQTPDPNSLAQESTDSNDKARFPNLPNEDGSAQSIDSLDSTSAQDTESVGPVEESSASNTLSSTDSLFVHVWSCPTSPSKVIPSSAQDTESVGNVEESSATNTLSSADSLFVHVWSCPTSPPRFIPSSIDSGAPIENLDSVVVCTEDSQYAECEETQSAASVTLSSTANVMVRRENIAEPRQNTMPKRNDVENKKTAKSPFERQSVSIDSGTVVYGEEIAHGTPPNTHSPSDEIEMKLNKPAVEENLVATKKVSNIDPCKKNLHEQAATKNKVQFKEQLKVDKDQEIPSLGRNDESKMQLREQISTGEMLRNQEASGSSLKQDPASVAPTEQFASNTAGNPQLSPDIPSASSATSDLTTLPPGASSSTQQAASRYPPRRVKLTYDSLPSWNNMSMTQARRGRGMYGGGYKQHGEDSPPKEKRPLPWARDLPQITVENLRKHLRGRRYVRLGPYKEPYISLTERMILEDMAKGVDLTKKKKKKKKKKRRSRYACADDSSSSSYSSDDEQKSPKKSLPPSPEPELQFHMELP